MVGNDIVDLSYFDSPSRQHIGYLKRVCNSEEVRDVWRSTSACNHLAVLWAAKEAAYKLAAKQSAIGHFVPRQFATHSESDLLGAKAELIVSCAEWGQEVRVKTTLTERWIHAVATNPKVTTVCWAVREMEQGKLPSPQVQTECAAVRSLANDLIARFGGQGLTLQFFGRIPRLMQIGLQTNEMDISLSHHGAFVGVAIGSISTTGNVTLGDGQCFGRAKDFSLEEMCYSCMA